MSLPAPCGSRLALLATLLACGCGGSSPASPSSSTSASVTTTPTSGPTATPSPEAESPLQLVIAPVSPANESTVAYNTDAALTVTNAAVPSDRLVLVTFQLATEPSFASPIASPVIPQSSTGPTTCHIDMQLSATKVGATVYWRARAGSSESTGAWTTPQRFTITERQDAPAVLFAEAPTAISPANGALQHRQATLVARAGAHSSGPTELRFYLSTTPSFSSSRCLIGLGSNDTEGRCQLSGLEPGTYYWRVITSTTRAGSSMLNGLQSTPSATQTFRVEGASINTPVLSEPADNGALVYPRPTFTLPNVARSGAVGSLSYRFDVQPNTPFATMPVAVTATVPEGVGSTSWTVPADLLVGVPYTVKVTAIDRENGYESQVSFSRYFSTVSRSNTLLTLTIETRCGTEVIPAASTASLGALSFVATTAGTMAIRLNAPSASAPLTGVIEGRATYPQQTAIGSSSSTATASLPTNATIGPAGELTGTFDGTVWHDSSYGMFACPGTGYRWTLRR